MLKPCSRDLRGPLSDLGPLLLSLMILTRWVWEQNRGWESPVASCFWVTQKHIWHNISLSIDSYWCDWGKYACRFNWYDENPCQKLTDILTFPIFLLGEKASCGWQKRLYQHRGGTDWSGVPLNSSCVNPVSELLVPSLTKKVGTHCQYVYPATKFRSLNLQLFPPHSLRNRNVS